MQSRKVSERKRRKRAAAAGAPITWPPSETEWDEIMRELPAETRAPCRTAVEAAVQEYLTGRSAAERRRQWARVKKLAGSKTFTAFCDAIRKLASEEDPEINRLLELVDQLEELPKKAGNRAFVYGLRNRKMRLRAALIRAWTDAGGNSWGIRRRTPATLSPPSSRKGRASAYETRHQSRDPARAGAPCRPDCETYWIRYAERPDRRRVRNRFLGSEERRIEQLLRRNSSLKMSGALFRPLIPILSVLHF